MFRPTSFWQHKTTYQKSTVMPNSFKFIGAPATPTAQLFLFNAVFKQVCCNYCCVDYTDITVVRRFYTNSPFLW